MYFAFGEAWPPKDPAKRPATALQVAAALPGGDPLAAARAAVETPSPEMVAASGESEGQRPAVEWVVLAGLVVSVITAILRNAQTMLYRKVPLEKPPEALAERARDILQKIGYYSARATNHGQLGLELLNWQEALSKHWPALRFGSAAVDQQAEQYFVPVQVYLDELDAEAVKVEL